jgi:hypothetical protein
LLDNGERWWEVSKAKARAGRRLLATAHHEAGHAVVAHDLGRRFKRVSIVAADDYLGCVEHPRLPRWFQPDVEMTPRMERLIDDHVLVSLAGPAAEAAFTGHRNRIGASGDYETVLLLAERRFDGRLLRKYVEYMAERAKTHVASFRTWIMIQGLAAALVERGTLTGEEARLVCMAAFEDAMRT